MTTVLDQTLSDDDLRSILSRYTPDLSERWDALRKQSAMERFVVPAVGVQGSGKSTLLNALLFDHPVLPVDADETTCVPVEVVEGAPGAATVYFHDGRTEAVSADEAALAQFVHQDHNPGNELGVSRIQVASDSPLLQGGAVLVDLPGLGSLTAENRETTLRYLQEASGLLYLLRTVPPMTRSEAVDLGLVWPRLPVVFFAQNRWTDETDRECASGQAHNRSVLRQVARGFGRELPDGEPEIRPVVGFDAYRGRLEGDAEAAERSGLAALQVHLEEVFAGWPAEQRRAILAAVLADLRAVDESIHAQLADLSRDQATAEEALRNEMDRRTRALEAAAKQVRKLRDRARRYSTDEVLRVDSWEKETKQELRNRMRTLMRKGIVDGARLDVALSDNMEELADPAWLASRDAALELANDIRDTLGRVKGWSRRDVVVDGPGLTESFKWEEGLAKGGNVVGAAGGAYAGLAAGAWTAAKVGAAVGAPGGPMGSAAGAIVGAAVGILGILIGKKVGGAARDLKRQHRAKQNQAAVFSAVDRAVRSVADAQRTTAGELSNDVTKELRTWRKAEEQKLEDEHSQRLDSIRAPTAEREARQASLMAHSVRVSETRHRLQGVHHE